MKLFQFVIIRLTLFLVLGILIGYYLNPDFTLSTYILGILALLAFILMFKHKQSIFFGIIISIAFLVTGSVITQLHNPKNWKNHYTNFVTETQNYTIVLKIKDVLKPNRYSQRYIANIISVDEKKVSGKVLLYIKRDSTSNQKKFCVDDILFTKSTLNTFKTKSNPGQFDYKNYLEKQYIFHNVKTSPKLIFSFDEDSRSIYGYANQFRDAIIKKLKTYPFSNSELAIINALFLGKRHDIDNNTFKNYSNAGAIHILAISGLHIGILLILLNILFKPLIFFEKGKIIKTVIIICLLWGVAFITGLSASILRAVTMFSIVQLATLTNRETNIYNTLAISAFILLLVKPLFLFDVGFQLSYAAVIAIVTIQPLAFKFWYPKYFIVRYLWGVLSVSVAAQIGVLPLSLFYFHKFAGLFWLTNLIIIPILGGILGIGILVIGLALGNILPDWLVKSFGLTIKAMNTIIEWISDFESFVISSIPFNFIQTIITYLVIICMIQFIIQKKYVWLVSGLLAIILIQIEILTEHYFFNTDEFIVFHKYKSSIIGIKKGRSLYVYSDVDSLKHNSTLKDYRIAHSIKSITHKPLEYAYTINNEHLLVVDSSGIYNIKTIVPKYVLLRSSPKINLNRLIDSIKPKLIIADGSNFNSYIDRWQLSCLKKNIPFHQTTEKGAFTIKLKR